ncbi:MAG: DNA-processing protein DprA [Bernardetiaceae bacterium]|jgi:DNA processing protein|nr:DNA-processing protein DprA [Bernardetiaceae bacterium]
MMTISPQQKLHEVALTKIPGIGRFLTRTLVSYCGTAQQVFATPKGRLLKIPQVGEKAVQAIQEHAAPALKLAEAELAQAQDQRAQVLFFTDAAFPARLRDLPDAPVLLYYQGQADLNHPKTVAVVGTRKATDYGRQVTETILEGLAKHNPMVISGLAYGIDIAAHRAALKLGLPTLGILGSGLDVVYPALHKATAQQMQAQGGLLSEYPFGVGPDAPHFPARNRVIAGLADVVIVVEAAETGGALITAELANGYHREVMAVPGSIFAPYSAGCHLLLKQHKAAPCTSAADVEYLTGWDNQAPSKSPTAPRQAPTGLPSEQMAVVQLLAAHPELHLDDIGWQSGLGVSRAAVVLLELEFGGLVKALPGKRFVAAW